AAGGMAIITDNQRGADSDNPDGYYEFERVKQLSQGDYAWLTDAEGKAVKIISALLQHLPPDHHYQVIFMHRHMAEILASQKKMLANRGEAANQVSDAELAALFENHKQKVQGWLGSQPNVTVLDVDYNQLVTTPEEQLKRLIEFVNHDLELACMMRVIDPALYRNRTVQPATVI
ncbi:MAG: sulfotransferase, partial [Caldilineaceae bacterium]|nr:sulfotransferase [Caldilineaceae bacterium]